MTILAWWSAGVTSAVACKIACEQFGKESVKLVYIKIDSAHSDNDRFLKDCEQWYEKNIETVQSTKYKDQFEVIEKEKYINGPNGAPCTKHLKKNVRLQIEKEIDYLHQIFGFDYSEKEINRAIRFIEQYPNSKPLFPLIENKITKEDCLKILLKNNIQIPKMYQLGFNNNNCIGCVKGGKGYWNHIRLHFPETFKRMSDIEDVQKHSCIKGIFLKDLKPNTGRLTKMDIPDCSLFCDLEFTDIIDEKTEQILQDLIQISDIKNNVS